MSCNNLQIRGEPALGLVRPCGQCLGCRLDYSRAKATRAMHETEYHDCSSFITLTYDDPYLIYNPSSLHPTLVKRDLQLFWKQLRSRIKSKISYMACGEYGEHTERPHYHAIVFGYDFSDDRKYYKNSPSGSLYNSQILSDSWGNKGHCVIGDVTFDSASYVASYTVKKLTGEMGKETYEKLGRLPPFGAMSTKPAIGKRWIEDNLDDVVNHDSVVVRGHEQRPPRYYDEYLKKYNPKKYDKIKSERQRKMKEMQKKNIIANPVNTEIIANSKIDLKSSKL